LRAAGFSRNPVPAGRTDLGVHARMQVLGMRLVEDATPDDLARRLNAQLPPSVGIALARYAPKKFHPQWQSRGKEYRYRLLLKDDERWAPYAWRIDVDPRVAYAELRRARGTRDFFAFHDKSSSRMSRTLEQVECAELSPHVWELRLFGPGFARYMVRYLVGAAVGLARGELRREDFDAALDHATSFEGIKAPAKGLVLWQVRYGEAMDPFASAVPNLPRGPPF
jgi:tRNA pseudouridine38-40 synthase